MNSLFKNSFYKLSKCFMSHQIRFGNHIFYFNNPQDIKPLYNENDCPSIQCKGRNSKPPKRANHGARPCSSVMRQLKKRAYYRKDRTKW